MHSFNLTKRELHIKSIFLPENKSGKKEYLSEDKVNEIIKQISNIGERYGFIGDKENKDLEKSSKRKHKYDVWIAKEIKKNLDLLNQFSKIRFIIDWAIGAKVDIFCYSFEDAFNKQEQWHKEMFEKYNIEDFKIQEVDNNRVLFRCSNKKHFIYLLTENDLIYEGKKMSMCVGQKYYMSKVKNERSVIVSLRDEKNCPHVTTEIDIKSGTIIQQSGKGNTIPSTEYKKMMLEFVLFATGYTRLKNDETIHL